MISFLQLEDNLWSLAILIWEIVNKCKQVKVVCESNIQQRRLISFNMLTTPPLMLMSTFLSMHEHHPQQPFGDLDNSGVVELLLSSRQVQTFIPRSKVITHIQPKGGWEGFWGLRQGIEVWGVSTDQKKNILSLHISGYHHHCTLREGFPKKVAVLLNLSKLP